jgi:alpha-2-macroglobulin
MSNIRCTARPCRTRPVRRRWLPGLLATLALATGLAGCGPSKPGDGAAQPAAVRNDAQWPQYIAEHSAGLVSRTAQIRIRFVSDVIAESEVGRPIDGLLQISPTVAAAAVFNTPRELLLVPSAPLASGQRYELLLRGKALPALPAQLGDYRFAVNVIEQALDVAVAGIDLDPASPGGLIVRGTLSTADVAAADAVEKALTAQLDSKPVVLRWQHAGDGRRHGFATVDLPRGAQPATLQLRWDGSPIGAGGSGEQAVEVPARGVFEVSRIGVGGDGQQALLVDFSEALDARQNLAGLITLSSGEFTHRIDGNTLSLFPATLRGGQVDVTLSAALRAADGRPLGRETRQTVRFETLKPGVRFVGQGSILPDAERLSIPFEAINVAAVQVTAFRVYDSNLGQFLQANPLSGSRELKRVGRYLWKKSITLGNGRLNEWRRFGIDVSELYAKEPGALYRFTLSIHRGNSLYACSEAERAAPLPADALPANDEEFNENDASGWDFAEDYFDGARWQQRDNPCQDGYYQYNDQARSSRNFIAANIGLIAKAGSDGRLHFVSSNLRSGEPLAGVRLRLYNYQDQEIGRVSTDADGMAALTPEVKPFYLAADHGAQRGYLKLGDGLALPVSHFDVGGVAVERGIKGAIYGERGVWRPGDTVYLTFVLQDPNDAIPDGHPATLELINPLGQSVHSQTNTRPLGGFYAFALATHDNDPTGAWRAVVKLGGRQFERALKIETVMPNRLKIELATGERLSKHDSAELRLFSQWLHGASAAGLKADVAVRLKPGSTRFTRNSDFVFEDPTRQYRGEQQMLWEGKLDAEGRATIDADIVADDAAAGFLSADFTTRVFEPGGAFSIAGQSVPFHPYRHYVGIKLPKGDLSRNMLLTDIAHPVEIATLDADGQPASLPNIEVAIYKIEWRWWWEQGGDGLANFAEASSHQRLQHGAVATTDGSGRWQFEIKFPDWGRYLVRACDRDGGHCAAQVVYIDWPGWAGRAAEQSGPGANALTLASDQKSYRVGDTARIQLPPASSGRALLSIENGSGILAQHWLQLDGKREHFELPISAAMAPNVYVSVSLLQPHEGKENDRPIRLYGVLPLLVENPATHLQPRLQVADEVRPESELAITVDEQQGRPMVYTLAVVDEGLLGLTNFRTPQLHGEFYRREALGVRTWDMYDEVIGAYGGALEKLLALGGSDDGINNDANKERKRFPPVVRFIGPFALDPGASATHAIDLPAYVGAVRVMLVAGRAGAYGSAEKTVSVRQPLMVQATLPRVLGPGEELRVPVSVFVLDERIRSVALSAEVEAPLEIVGDDRVTLAFERSGDQLGFIAMKVGQQLGKTRLRFTASAGAERAEHSIDIEVRAANPLGSVVQTQVVPAGGQWKATINPHGLPGTNATLLEVSRVPPLNLGGRLQYLVQYPHGCVEQTTSAAFPQLYLGRLLQLEPGEEQRIQQHVEAGIDRLRQFQQPGGGFGYWPGAADWNSWSSSYVGHFLLEAQRQGFAVPANMLASWKAFQQGRAQGWVVAGTESALDQAYRLYTLTLAGAPELGAMNRLRELPALPNTARWLLAAGYQQAGLADVARQVIATANLSVEPYAVEGPTFGSELRDRAILLESLLGIGDRLRARDLADGIAGELAGNGWHSTQSLSWALQALAHFAHGADRAEFAFDYALAGQDWQAQRGTTPIVQLPLAVTDAADTLTFANRSNSELYVNLISRGVPAAGSEQAAAASLTLSTAFTDVSDTPVDPLRIAQGQDIRARVTVRNDAARDFENLALSQIVPSGWEIIDTRSAATASVITESAFDYRDIRDDRVHTYFGLKRGESRSFVLQFNAAYPGRYYLPGWNVEAMYDASRHARNVGRWVEVVR